MTGTRHHRVRGQRGAVIVEAALVLPVLLLLFLALADFALAELSDAAGSNAAREGARVGILYYDGAHVAGSSNHDKITAAVMDKLAGNVRGTPTVTVRCLNRDGSARPSGGSCSTVGSDIVDVGRDFIEVSVRWDREGGITGFVGNGFRTDKAVMRIVGTPPTGSAGPPTTCSITAASATPATVVHTSGSIPAVTFEVTVSDAAACGAPLLAFPPEAGLSGVQSTAPLSATTFAFTLPAGQGTWTAGEKTVTSTANGGAVSQPITFTVNDPTVCLITAMSATPSTLTQIGGVLSSSVVVSVTVSDVPACGTPTLTFPAAAGYGGPQTMTSAGGSSYTFTLPIGQGSWPSSTYAVTANANDGATGVATFIVSNPAVCSLTNLTISPNPVEVTSSGWLDSKLTIRVQRSSTTLCAVPTVTVTAPSGSANGPMTCTGLTCTRTVSKSNPGWGSAPSTRTVTVSASGASVAGTLNLIRD